MQTHTITAQVMLLPTTSASPLVYRQKDGILHLNIYYGRPYQDMGDTFARLYFVTDGEIKEGDYYISNTKRGDVVFKSDGGKGLEQYYIDNYVTGTPINSIVRMSKEKQRCKKIIASTDASLLLDIGNNTPYAAQISQIPLEFVAKNNYGAWSIKEVRVETNCEDRASLKDQSVGIYKGDIYKIKTNPDNTVIIHY